MSDIELTRPNTVIVLHPGTEEISLEVQATTIAIQSRAVTSALYTDDPEDVGATAAGVSNRASRGDHVHAHGNQLGGSLHAAASSGSAGFLAAADKITYDGYASSITAGDAASVATAAAALATHAALTTTHGVSGALVGTTDSQALSNKTLTTPTIASFVNATHSHQSAAGGGTLDAAAIAAGTVAAARLGSGTANASSFLRGDSTWVAVSVPVTSVFGRVGDVAAATNDYTWAQINKATSDLADITTKSHASLSSIGTNTHAQIDTHLAATTGVHGATALNTASAIVTRDSSGNFAAGSITGATFFGDTAAIGTTSLGNSIVNIRRADDAGLLLRLERSTAYQYAFRYSGVGANLLQLLEPTLGSPIMIWDGPNERVGIGTLAPTQKLDVTGSIAVSGNVDGRDVSTDGATLDAHVAATSAHSSTSANTASRIVARDSSGNFSAGTITAALTGNASTATALATARAINGVSFDGTAAITVTATTTNALSIGTHLAYNSGSTFDGSAARTLSTDATDANTASTIVARDASGNFTAGTITAALTGNATTATLAASATKLATARAINGVNFDGSAAITITASTTAALSLGTHLSYASGTTFDGGTARTIGTDATDANTASTLVARDASGNFSAGTVSAALTGNATTATALATSRTLWGQGFTGAANVTGSLTSVGDITGGASSMVITAGTGNSRTLILKTTTSGGTATTALTLGADQSAVFGGTASANPSGGSGTEAWGASVTASSTNQTVVGASAIASGTGSTVVGSAATTSTFTNAIAIGLSATVGANSDIAIGQGSSVSGATSVGIGTGITLSGARGIYINQGTGRTASGADQILIGSLDATSTNTKWVAIGSLMTLGTSAAYAEGVSIGYNATVGGTQSTGVGAYANNKARCVSLGYAAQTYDTDNISIGYNAQAGGAGGGSAINNTVVGNNAGAGTVNNAVAVGASSVGGGGCVSVGASATTSGASASVAVGTSVNAASCTNCTYVGSSISSTGGTGNTLIGKSASMSSSTSNGTAVGLSATVGTGSTAVGASASTGTFTNAVAIGLSSVIGVNSGIAIGNAANVSGTTAVGIGASITLSGANGVYINSGTGRTISGADSIVVGSIAGTSTNTKQVIVGTSATVGTSTAYDSVVGVGYGVTIAASNATVVGASATVSGSDSIAIGKSATTSTFTNSLAVGSSATCTANNQAQLGTSAQPYDIVTYGTVTLAAAKTLSWLGRVNLTATADFSTNQFVVNNTSNTNVDGTGIRIGTADANGLMFYWTSAATAALTTGNAGDFADLKLKNLQLAASATVTWLGRSKISSSGASQIDILDSTGNAYATLAAKHLIANPGQIAATNVVTSTPAGTTQTLDFDTGNVKVLDLGSATGTVTVTLSNMRAGGSYVIKVVQDNGITPRTATFTGVKWPGGVPPVISTGAFAVDMIFIEYDGTTAYGTFSQAFA